MPGAMQHAELLVENAENHCYVTHTEQRVASLSLCSKAFRQDKGDATTRRSHGPIQNYFGKTMLLGNTNKATHRQTKTHQCGRRAKTQDRAGVSQTKGKTSEKQVSLFANSSQQSEEL